MEIFKESKESDLFWVMKLNVDQLIDFRDICQNFRSNLQRMLKLSDEDLAKNVKTDSSIEKTREDMRKQISTCAMYEAAFVEFVNTASKANG